VSTDASSDEETMTVQTREAPGDLDTVRAFVNTLDLDDMVDHIAAPAELVVWLSGRGLLPPETAAGPADVRRAHLFREALRAVLLSNNDGRPVPADAARTMDDVAARARLRLRVAAGAGPGASASLEAEGRGVDGALGRLLVIVYRAMENDTWRRLKACRNDTCLWAFYDHSKNRSGHWCTMDTCGSQHKARQYRARHKTTPAGTE
jgi:predicted RNA-binding Zn ribbon-like protein